MPNPQPIPQLIQVKKYPNRRLYDRTRSRHLTHEELYDLVVAGHTVSVTDSKTGADITNLVLTQALIERGPEKFASFPPELFHLMIRASEQMLRGMATGWFAQVIKGMGSPIPGPHESGNAGGNRSTSAAGTSAAGFAGFPNLVPNFVPGVRWPPTGGFPWAPQPGASSDSAQPNAQAPSAGPPDAVANLEERLQAMMREIANLKKSTRSST
ncbi:MAG: polyhydroxyalkanoate synthesis regulator DNA-binding domain-containing protein [Phycisphaerae bacterium]|nr:polyhydroxyalkanoate synthesis regulator DNA-binding domain-containing protein [Phycisphaerae bacterium]